MRFTSTAIGVSLILASCTDQAAPFLNPTPIATAPSKPSSQNPPPVIAPGKVDLIFFEDFFALHQSGKILLYDARPAFFYRLGHIPGAINVPRGTRDEQISKRNPEIRNALVAGKTVVTYCTGQTCPDAHTLADQISALGHPVSIFSDGWHAWTAAEMPTE